MHLAPYKIIFGVAAAMLASTPVLAQGQATASASANAPASASAAAKDRATAPLAYPAALIMPWRVIGIDPLERGPARPALTQSITSMASAILTSPATFTTLLKAQPPTINRQRLTDQMMVGAPKIPLPNQALTVEPTWCSLMDRHLFIVTVADSQLNTLLGSAHISISRTRWKDLGQAQSAFLQEQLPKLASAALKKAQAKGNGAATDTLNIGLSLGRNVTRNDEGFSHCVNLLVEERLAPDYTVARNLGTDHLATVRDALGLSSALRRPTRGFVMSWANPPETKPNRVLPVTLALKVQVAETVFGQPVPIKHQSNWAFSVGAGEQIQFTLDPAFKKILDDERSSLKVADMPQVAKIDRAWVYLDRGRAWGLKMNDRLVANTVGGDPKDLVKGHVVRFFGPEEGITSPRGFPIREGAIVFVRKSQRSARVGMTFRPDARQYATPFPIPPGG